MPATETPELEQQYLEPESPEVQDGVETSDQPRKPADVEPEGAPEAEPEPTRESHEPDEQLLGIARQIGFDDSTLAALGTTERIEGAVLGVLRSRRAEKIVGEPEKGQPPERPEAIARLEANFKKDDWDETLATFGTNVVATVNSLVDRYERFEHILSDIYSVMRENETERSFQQFDGLIGQLGEEYHELFGTGATRSLNEKTEHYQNRSKVWDAMEMLRQGAIATKGRAPSDADLFQMATRIVTADKTKEMARSQVEKGLANRRKAAIAKPTGRREKPLSGEEAAIARADKWIESMRGTQLGEELSEPGKSGEYL